MTSSGEDKEQLVRRIAGRIYRTLAVRSQARFRALVAAGMLAIQNIEERFDPSRDVSFASFVKHRIHFAMFDAMRRFETEAEINEHSTAA